MVAHGFVFNAVRMPELHNNFSDTLRGDLKIMKKM